jgi:hypothetical protein
MPQENSLALRQVDQERSDFYAIESELDIIKAQFALLPTRKELARIALGVIFGGARHPIDRGVLAALPMTQPTDTDLPGRESYCALP